MTRKWSPMEGVGNLYTKARRGNAKKKIMLFYMNNLVFGAHLAWFGLKPASNRMQVTTAGSNEEDDHGNKTSIHELC